MTVREHDLVLLGATGFTGGLVAQYLAASAPQHLNVALAGRDESALRARRAQLPGRARQWPVLAASAEDADALARLAGSCRLMLTTVGPYARLGMPVVEACVQAGTDYIDLSGEIPFLRSSIDRFQDDAEQHGIRLVQTCGIVAAVVDLAVWDLAQHAAAAGSGQLTDVIGLYPGFVGQRSSGTSASTIEGLAALRDSPELRRLARDPYALSPDRASEPDLGPQRDRSSFDYDTELDTWLGPFWYESLQTRVVRRTNALLGYDYGREFRYREATDLGNGRQAVLGRLRTLRQIGWVPLMLNPRTGRFVEAVMRRAAPPPRSGPDESNEVALAGTIIAHTSSGAVHREHVQAPLGGYHATAVIMTQMALALLYDRDHLPDRHGFLTPAAAGDGVLLDRLRQTGFEIRAE